VIGPFDNWDARLRASQALFDRAAGLRTGAAREQAVGAGAERALAAEAAAERAAVAYVAVQRAAALVDARAADSALAAELVTLARTQLVTRAGALVVARAEQERARLALGRALGLEPTVPVVATDALAPETATLPLALEREALAAAAGERRPDIAVELARGRAAERSAAAIAAERWPRIEVAGDVGVNGPAPDAMRVTRQIGVQVTVPLVDGFSLESRRDQQLAAGRAAAVRAADLRRAVAAEVDAALLALRAAEAQRAIATEGMALADEELRQARERFAAGVAGSIELVEAQRSLVAAREAVIEALAAGAAARIGLARAAGVAREIR
jgi:outer membrane protein TolC